ncbi:ribonuclease domain-containing protein [Dialister invisus]|uniref:ribonuclease domain-containing protein n=1 Tax=Dialister invisus TaxID=218538 RepID=UPI0028E8FF53|nr:ribonuclease domain-containing protein [Dialister invisus]
MKKFFAAILTVFLSLGLLTACGGGQQHGASSTPAVQSVERSDTGSADKSKSRIRQNKIYTGSESISQNGGQSDTKSPGSAEIRVERDQAYTDKDHVAAYIHIYRKLPPNYITKAEAKQLGWKDKGTLDQVAPGKSIGGDRFSNYEKILPDAPGRNWKECDIDYVKGNRNAKRICFSNDGLIYYTSSHYQDFEKIY